MDRRGPSAWGGDGKVRDDWMARVASDEVTVHAPALASQASIVQVGRRAMLRVRAERPVYTGVRMLEKCSKRAWFKTVNFG
jgi:hypothetical protein